MQNRNPENPHSANLRKFRCTQESATFFVTKCLEPRKKVLAGPIAKTICKGLCYYAENEEIMLAAFVVMPDHWHALFATLNGETIKQRMHTAGSWIGRSVNNHLRKQGVKWQDGFYETRIRSSKQFSYVLHYIEHNPVRAGLTEQKENWLWSSAFPDNKRFLSLPWPWMFEKDV